MPAVSRPTLEEARAYLCVEAFLQDFLGAQALHTAFALGWIEQLRTQKQTPAAALGQTPGARLLLSLLIAHGMVETVGGQVALTPAFRQALAYEDLLRAKLDFAQIAAGDFLQWFPQLVERPAEFQSRAAMYRLFAYGAARETTPEALAITEHWMRLTTMLTRYEAGVAHALYDFSAHRQWVDIGGNSGEFAVQICAQVPALQATVFDLPAVCAVGQGMQQGRPGAAQVRFQPGNALTDELPATPDLVSFKSMLHDWPEAEAAEFLQRGASALAPGGALLIFERDVVDLAARPLPFGSLPLVAFANSYRGPQLYADWLAELHFTDLQIQRVELDLPFFLLTARKPT